VTGDGPMLVFREKAVEWLTSIPFLFKDKGTGTITIDAKASPATIELKVGDTVYKGIWKIFPDGRNKKRERLQLVLSAPGGDFPKEFPKEDLPKGFKGVDLHLYRDNK